MTTRYVRSALVRPAVWALAGIRRTVMWYVLWAPVGTILINSHFVTPPSSLEGLSLIRPCPAATAPLDIFWRAYPTALYNARRNREAGRGWARVAERLAATLFMAEDLWAPTKIPRAACMENPTPEPRSGTDPAALSVLVVLLPARTRCPARDRHDTAMGFVEAI
jgi:hypothetical protein